MSYAPATLVSLAHYWVNKGGVNLGIVGDASHTNKGTSYHLGADLLQVGAYSKRTARDRAGLTNAASAIDLGRLDWSLTKLWKFSRWFAQQCMEANPAYNDVREVIFWSPTRGRVIGWSDLAPTQWINDYGDISHKTHTHISFYRDSEKRSKVALFAPYFLVASPPIVTPPPDPTPPPAGDTPMPDITTYIPGYDAVIKTKANVRSSAMLVSTNLIRTVTAPETWDVTGWVTGAVDPDGGSDQWLTRWSNGRWEYTAKSNVVSLIPPAGAPAPAPDCTAAVDAATAPLKTALATTQTALAQSEAARAQQAVTLGNWEAYATAHNKVGL